MSEERSKIMDKLIAQDADLIDKLRDEDSYYRLQEKHWCIDSEELERQRLAAADRIEQLEREKAVVSDLWEQQKEIALDYLADCNKAADLIETQAREIERLRGVLGEIMERGGAFGGFWCALAAQEALTGDSHDQ